MNLGDITEMGKVPMPAYLAKFYTELNTCSGCIHPMYSVWQGNHVSNVPGDLGFQVILCYDEDSPVQAQQ